MCSHLNDELNHLKDKKRNLETTLTQVKAKLVQMDRQIDEKRIIEDKMENDLRFLRTNIIELERIEYPPENEDEILVIFFGIG